MQIALRERNRNGLVLESLVDRKINIAGHIVTSFNAFYSDSQLKV